MALAPLESLQEHCDVLYGATLTSQDSQDAMSFTDGNSDINIVDFLEYFAGTNELVDRLDANLAHKQNLEQSGLDS